MRSLDTFGLRCTRQTQPSWIDGGEILGLWECCDKVEIMRDGAVIDQVC